MGSCRRAAGWNEKKRARGRLICKERKDDGDDNNRGYLLRAVTEQVGAPFSSRVLEGGAGAGA